MQRGLGDCAGTGIFPRLLVPGLPPRLADARGPRPAAGPGDAGRGRGRGDRVDSPGLATDDLGAAPDRRGAGHPVAAARNGLPGRSQRHGLDDDVGLVDPGRDRDGRGSRVDHAGDDRAPRRGSLGAARAGDRDRRDGLDGDAVGLRVGGPVGPADGGSARRSVDHRDDQAGTRAVRGTGRAGDRGAGQRAGARRVLRQSATRPRGDPGPCSAARCGPLAARNSPAAALGAGARRIAAGHDRGLGRRGRRGTPVRRGPG